MVEAMWRLYWEQFEKWLNNENYGWRLDILKANLLELSTEFEGDDLDENRIKDKNKVSY